MTSWTPIFILGAVVGLLIYFAIVIILNSKKKIENEN
jgi:hypothetical protein